MQATAAVDCGHTRRLGHKKKVAEKPLTLLESDSPLSCCVEKNVVCCCRIIDTFQQIDQDIMMESPTAAWPSLGSVPLVSCGIYHMYDTGVYTTCKDEVLRDHNVCAVIIII